MKSVTPLLDLARSREAEVIEIECDIRKDYDRLLVANWHLGQTLCDLKEDVGHSKWLIWLGANMKQLAGDDGRRAQRVMALFRDNEDLSDPSQVADFDVDSVRKFLGGYMPAKLRPRLAGDERMQPVLSFDGGTNRFAAVIQRIKQGHAQPPPWDTVSPQVKLIVEGLREIYGPERLQTLLG